VKQPTVPPDQAGQTPSTTKRSLSPKMAHAERETGDKKRKLHATTTWTSLVRSLHNTHMSRLLSLHSPQPRLAGASRCPSLVAIRLQMLQPAYGLRDDTHPQWSVSRKQEARMLRPECTQKGNFHTNTVMSDRTLPKQCKSTAPCLLRE